MSQVTKYFCDACDAEIGGPGPNENKMGLVITIGFSKRGWGHRDNLVDFSGEVCEACYIFLGSAVAEIVKERLKDAQNGHVGRIYKGIFASGPPVPPKATVRLSKTTWWERVKRCFL